MAYLLGCDNVHLEYPTKKVFDSVTLGIDEGDRIGIVGGNGDGKSSLLSLLAGSVEPDDGRIMRRGGTTIGTLAQTDALDPEATVAQEVVGDAPEHTWASDARIRGILRGLDRRHPLGWPNRRPFRRAAASRGSRPRARRRLRRAHARRAHQPSRRPRDRVAGRPPQEPLAEEVGRAPRSSRTTAGSSTRSASACGRCTTGSVEQFEGGYSAYVLQRVERAEAAQTAEQKRRNVLRKELAWLSRGARARATKPKFHVDAARALIADEPPVRDSIELKRTAISRLGKQVVDLVGVTERFGDQDGHRRRHVAHRPGRQVRHPG